MSVLYACTVCVYESQSTNLDLLEKFGREAGTSTLLNSYGS